MKHGVLLLALIGLATPASAHTPQTPSTKNQSSATAAGVAARMQAQGYSEIQNLQRGPDGKWVGNELRAESGTLIYVPKGVAHGFITLEPNTSVDYLLSESYAPEAAGGVRWDDPQFDIRWPFPPA